MLGGLGVNLWVLRVGCGGGGRSRPSKLCSDQLVRGRRRRSRGGGFACGWLSLWRGLGVKSGRFNWGKGGYLQTLWSAGAPQASRYSV